MNKNYISTSALYGPYLAHHGIKGQKWGIRRYQNEDGTLTEAGKKRYSQILKIDHKNLDVYLARRKSKDSSSLDYSVLLNNGKRIGNVFLENHGDDLYINWINIKTKQRGQGIATSILNHIDREAKIKGYRSMSLEVPEFSPDARHIYEKIGFKIVDGQSKEITADAFRKALAETAIESGKLKEDDISGVLAKMKKVFY